VLSGRGLCDGLITRLLVYEYSNDTECGVSEYDREASTIRRP
jgi:hypothetical protein